MIEKDRDQLDELTGDVLELEDLVGYQSGSVVSRTLVDKETVTLTLFAFDEEQTLSEHTSPHKALLQVLEGTGKVIIEGEEYELQRGETIVMPADVPHAVEAVEKFKMFLTMVK
ncbi:MAG: cupin domain-containing protein [Candidatus Thermoplasmatota archaeon]|nr:cupin domain-containing protein [Candidatus Thermoplasmatota archaeon]